LNSYLYRTETDIPDETLPLNRRKKRVRLQIRQDHIATSNDAINPENLGVLDFVQLPVPLPDNLDGSEFFARHPGSRKEFSLMVG